MIFEPFFFIHGIFFCFLVIKDKERLVGLYMVTKDETTNGSALPEFWFIIIIICKFWLKNSYLVHY